MSRRGRGVAPRLTLIAIAATGTGLLLGACGDDEEPAASTVTVTEESGASGASGEQGRKDVGASTGGEPAENAVDPNDPEEGTDPYDVYGNTWGRLSKSEQAAAAEAYIADNPERCTNASAEDIANHVQDGYGIDFPLSTLASKIMGETCDLASAGD